MPKNSEKITSENEDVNFTSINKIQLIDQSENNCYTKSEMIDAYRSGEIGKTFYFKDTTVILPHNYEGIDG